MGSYTLLLKFGPARLNREAEALPSYPGQEASSQIQELPEKHQTLKSQCKDPRLDRFGSHRG